MAFDLYLGEEHTCIDHYEEGLFDIIGEDERYPCFNGSWKCSYDGPDIPPHVANKLVHELISLRDSLSGTADTRHVVITILKILPFLSKAYTSGRAIKCASD